MGSQEQVLSGLRPESQGGEHAVESTVSGQQIKTGLSIVSEIKGPLVV